MRILHVASEAVPFAKTGGLADVVGALPKYVRQLGHESVVVLPKYRGVSGKRLLLPSLQEHEPHAVLVSSVIRMFPVFRNRGDQLC